MSVTLYWCPLDHDHLVPSQSEALNRFGLPDNDFNLNCIRCRRIYEIDFNQF